MRAAKIPSKFSTLSRSMSIPPQHLVTFPKSSPSTAPNYPASNFHRPQLRDRACRRAQTVSRAISFLATALLAISSCYLLSLAIWRYLPPGSPCSPLSVPCLQLSLQTQIVLTSPVTFKALPPGHTTTLCHIRQKTILGRIKSPPKQGQC